MIPRQLLMVLLSLSVCSSALAADGADLERATQACSEGAWAFTMVSEKLANEIDIVDSEQGREAFLVELESLDKQSHEMQTFKVIWLLSLSDALSHLRHRLDINASAARGSHVSAARIEQLRVGTWNYAGHTFAEVCMFRAGRLLGQRG